MSVQSLATRSVWQRRLLRSTGRSWDGRARGLVAALLGAAAAGIASQTTVIERIDERTFDAQVGIVRALRDPAGAVPTGQDVVLVGVDEASLTAFGVPMAMMHAPLGKALEAIAAARPLAIGLDMALPERSFDHLRPGLERDLMRGLMAARTAADLVLALDVDASGHLRIPSPALLVAAGGTQAFGLPLFPVDCDGVVRRFDPDPVGMPSRYRPNCVASADPDSSGLGSAAALARELPQDAAGAAAIAVPTFAARLARRLGREVVLSRPGWIDFTRGSAFSYIPLLDVLGWYESGEAARLREAFGGRIVLVGSVLPFLDRLRLPVSLVGWEYPATPPPGVILNAQLLRNASGVGLLRPVWLPAQMALLVAMVSIALVAAPWARWCWWAVALAGSFAAAAALHAAGWFLAPGAAILAASTAVVVRTSLDLAHARRERDRLARTFGGYLSPQLLHAVLEDRVAHGSARRAIAMLFADLRGFTTWSETADPELVRETLNRYYAAITPLLHAHGGTIDNFRGDGIMVMFGAPEPHAQACDSAFAAARQILAAVERFNRLDLVPRGVVAIEVAIGLAYGEVVVGDLGSPERKDYTALGDAVNVAARLQELAKLLGFPLVMTQAFARRLSADACGVRELGTHALKGHTPVAICGWKGAERDDHSSAIS